MLPDIVSPYGRDVLDEVERLFAVPSLEQFCDHLRRYLEERYQLAAVVIEQIHLAGAFAIFARAEGRRFVFKLDEHDDTSALLCLLQRIEALRRKGLPVPRLRKTSSGEWCGSPFSDGVYQGYLMDFVAGETADFWSTTHAQATATFLAYMHRLGLAEPLQPGEQSSFESRWPDLEQAVSRLGASGVLRGARLEQSRQLMAGGPPSSGLTWTHIHGDARLCHFLFSKNEISGVVDHDAGMWGQRLLDVAFHLISHPSSTQVAFLAVDDFIEWLGQYHLSTPLTASEQAAIPAALCCALLIEMGETLWCLETGKASVSIADLSQGVQLLEELQSQAEPLTAPVSSLA